MPKKTKKQRRRFDFEEVQCSSPVKEHDFNNSSSIISPVDQHESSTNQFIIQPIKISSKHRQVNKRKIIEFEEQQQEYYESQIHQDNPTQLSSTMISRYIEQNIDEKKQTVTTHNQTHSEIKQKNQATNSIEKIPTEHFSYDGSSSNSQQIVDSQEEQEQIVQKRKKTIKVQKQFVAQSLQDLVFAQIPENCTVTCLINFSHQFLSMTRTYNLYLAKQKRYLYSGLKRRLKLVSQFQFKTIDKKEKVLGSLKSNFTGLQYVVNRLHRAENRQSQQCWIGYDFNLLGLSHQRNITVLKNLNCKLQKIPFFSQIKNYYEEGITQNFKKFTNKRAEKNKNGDYELDFHGKVSQPSVKNFILVDQRDKQNLLLGKRTENAFVLQVGHPFSIFQGFAIAVSSLDHKLCVR